MSSIDKQCLMKKFKVRLKFKEYSLKKKESYILINDGNIIETVCKELALFFNVLYGSLGQLMFVVFSLNAF